MSNAPQFSILLPTHNRADVLPFAIRSVFAQTIQDFELLVVGDGCTDDTAKVMESFTDSRIRWFDLPKAQGIGYANRNAALRQARGTHIAFMAHDDLWLSDHLESFLPTFENPAIELVYTRPLWVIPKGLIAPGTFNLECPATLKSFLAKEKNEIPASCFVHRRACLEKYGYWSETLLKRGDLDLWSRIIAGGGSKNFAYLPNPTCIHFRANWRNDISLLGKNEIVWEHFHALENFMPAGLKIPIPDGITEQEAFWQAMSANPCEWSKQLRQAIQQALDQRISQSDQLIATLLRRHQSVEIGDLFEAIEELSLAWKPPFVLRKMIGLNNRIQHFRNGASTKPQ